MANLPHTCIVICGIGPEHRPSADYDGLGVAFGVSVWIGRKIPHDIRSTAQYRYVHTNLQMGY